MLHLMFDPRGMRPFVAGWDKVARSLLQRVQRETVGHAIDEGTRRLIDELCAYPDVPDDWRSHDAASARPVTPFIPLGFMRDDAVLNYFSMVTSVGTPQTVAAQELRIECMFPADEATEEHHARLMAD